MVLRAKGPAPTGVAVSRVLWFSESPWGAPELGLPAPPSEVLTTGSVSASQTREVYQYWWGTRFSETSGALGGGGHPGGGGFEWRGIEPDPGSRARRHRPLVVSCGEAMPPRSDDFSQTH